MRKPFDDTYRLTAYVDHNEPLEIPGDGNMYVFTGEENTDCPEANTTWDTEGPYCYDSHEGTDWALPGNTPVLVAAPGVVTLAGWEGGSIGNAVYVDHGNGYQTRYYHLASDSVDVGDQVVAGQQIALSGNTGTNQPYHLHFGVYYNDEETDPFGWRGSGTDPLPEGPAVCLWGDGQCSDTVVEDRSGGYFENGSGWNWWSGGNGWTMRYVNNKKTSSDASAIWMPNLPRTGPYSIFAFIPSQHATTQHAKYTIQPIPLVLPPSDVIVNQQSFSEDWVDLGNFDLYSGYSNVTLTDITGETNNTSQVGFDAIKFQQYRTYLPDVRNNSSWLTSIVMQNVSATSAEVSIVQYNSSGQVLGNSIDLSIPAHGREVRWPDNSNVASVMVASSEDITIEVENHNSALQSATNYTGITWPAQGYNPGWGEAATVLYAPTVKRNLYGRTTELYIMNVGSASTTIEISYYNAAGVLQNQNPQTCFLAPNARCKKTANSNWDDLLTAKIINTANQPLVGVAVERPESGNQTQVSTYNLLSNGATILYSPLIKNNYYGQSTGPRLQNASDSTSSDVTIIYYQDGSGTVYTSGPHTIPANGSITLSTSSSGLPNGFIGSAIIESTQPLVGNIHESGSARKMSFSAFQQGSQANYLPIVCNNCNDWYANGRVQNIGNAITNVNIQYYNSAGQAVGSSQSINNLGANHAKTFKGQDAPSTAASAIISADQPLAVTVNVVNSDTSKDLSMSYNALSR